MKLLSKVQYKNYEVGEYSLKDLRTIDETISLVKNYPWEENRHLTDVQLNCPSITVEHINGAYLKTGHYFGGKFCLYLLTDRGKLRSKVITRLEESFPIIAAFYNNENIGVDFESYTSTFNPKKHFVTKSFEYTVTPGRIFIYLTYPVIIYTVATLLVFLPVSTTGGLGNVYLNFLFICLFWFVFNGANVYLLFNYYFYSKNHFLKLSRGHNNFFFGTNENHREYLKSDIETITQYFNQRSKNPWGDNIVYEITFKNGKQIRFTSLLIGGSDFDKKMEGINIEQVHRFLATIK